ncbi:hypothetical protein BJ875DRAFT_447131 [Amylocarpus encephaloides]|uniref:JmjC domain-containing protein n=1 Tax=Amylocarpus encephaloides TaxID=45428 RepID=A0A9P7Y821_9HELO|nr:hypothetical protein BJ875DRAFT_447131 [Amylocarpus encephaloides]
MLMLQIFKHASYERVGQTVRKVGAWKETATGSTYYVAKEKSSEDQAQPKRESKEATVNYFRELPEVTKGARKVGKVGKTPRAAANFSFTLKEKGHWGSYTMMQIFPTIECIQGAKPPTFEEIFSKIALERKDIQEVLVAAFQPDHATQKASYAANLQLSSKQKWKMELPADFEHLTMANAKTAIPIGLNLCRNNAIFDFHLVENSNLACLVSGIRFSKVWFFALLTPHNLEIFKRQRKFGNSNQEQNFSDDIERLENLISIIQNPEATIWIPTGVLHATCTVGNGILYGSVFENIDDIHLMARGLSCLFTVSDDKQNSHLVARFKVVVERALEDLKYSVFLAMAFIDK